MRYKDVNRAWFLSVRPRIIPQVDYVFHISVGITKRVDGTESIRWIYSTCEKADTYIYVYASTKNENRIIRIIAHRNCLYKCSIYNNVQQIITCERRKCNISIRHTRMDFDDIGYILRMISVHEIEYKYYHVRKRDTC